LQNTESHCEEKRQQGCRTPKPLGAEGFGPERLQQGLLYRPVVSLGIQYAAALNFVTAFEDDSHGLGIDFVFVLEDAGGEGVLGVVVVYGDDGLEDDGAGVEIFVDEMDSAAGEFDAVFEGLALGFEAREGREERRVNVEDAIWKAGYEKRGEEAHVAS